MIDNDANLPEKSLAYIEAEAEKEPVAFRHLVEDGYAMMLELTHGLTNDQATFRAEASATNVIEIVQHVATVKRWCAKVCTALAHAETPEDPQGDALSGDDASFGAVLLELEGAHERMLDFAGSLWPLTDLTTRFAFEGVPAFNCKEWAVWQHLHDLYHADEIRAIQADGGYPFTRQAPAGKFRSAA
ncbi:MAG TPA: DinB family protein [Dehalococcoidia bacterium]